jgi:hypothetical protein
MSFQSLGLKLTLLVFTASILAACDSTGRNHSPNYHINAMERVDETPYCHSRCTHAHHHEPKDWNKDK